MRTLSLSFVAALTWTLCSSQLVFQQDGAKLVGTGAIGTVEKGSSLAISADGSTLAVGGPYDNSWDGATWVFTRSGGAWTQQGAKLVGTGIVGHAHQGTSLAMSADGSTLAVGGYSDNSEDGATWVFTRTGGVWTQQGAKLVGTGAVGAALQGTSLAISADGNTLAVGGWRDNYDAGATWIFTRIGGTWSQQGAKLVGTGEIGEASQGSSLAMSADGNTLAVGGPADKDFAGATWIFTRSGGPWTEQGAKLVGTGAFGEASQGSSLAISADGSTLAVAGPYDNVGDGATWIFTRSGGAWTQQGAKLVGTGAFGDASQGSSLAISADGSVLAIGGKNDNASFGATWVFISPVETLPPPPPLPSAAPGPILPLTPDSPGLGTPQSPSPSIATTTPPMRTNGGASHMGAIVGGSVTAALLVLVAAGVCVLWRWRRAAAAGKTPAVRAEVSAVRAASKPAAVGPVVATWVASDTTKSPPPLDKSSSRTNVSCGAGSLSMGTSTSSLARVPLKERTSSLHGASGQQATTAGGSSTYASTAPDSSFASIPAATTEEQALHVQLDHMHATELLLAGRYKLGDRRDRRGGGQGVVQFATLARNDRMHLAVKFFLDRAAFQTECAHFNNASLHHILPQVDDITDNSAAPFVLGRPLPPMVVMEKGESLDEWQRRAAAGFMTAANIMMDLVERVVDIHAAGLAHRDLKPANVIFYSARNQWTIIDFGGAAYIGSDAPFVCTPAYAAPETLRAMAAGRRPGVVDPAVDVWALGVMAWELFTQTRVFERWPANAIADAMAGQSLPWEAASEEGLRSLGFMKNGVLGMLARDPRERVSLPELLSKWRRMVQQTRRAT